MRKRVLLGIVILIIFGMVSGCNFEEVIVERPVKMLITSGGWGEESCVVEVKDNMLEVLSGEGIEDVFYKKREIDENIERDYPKSKRKKKRLSRRRIDIIDKYTEEIVKNGKAINQEYERKWMTDVRVVNAIIGDEQFNALYKSVDGRTNALQELAYELLNVSPSE